MNPRLALIIADYFPPAFRLCRQWAWIFGTMLIMTGQSVTGEEPVRIGAAQILADALAHSLALKFSDQDIAAAEARRLQARAQFLPTLNLDARAGHYEGLEDAAFGPGIVIPTVDNWYGASAVLSQPLFTGGRIISQKQSAMFQHKAATHSRRSAEAELRRGALTAYWNWSKTFYALDSLQAATTRMEAHAADMHNLHQAGLATDNDALSTDVLLDQTRLRLEEAKRREQLARARIAYLTGYPLPITATPDHATVPVNPTLASETEALSAARTNRAEYTARRMNLNAAQALIKAQRADYFPHLYATARYDQAQPNAMDFPPMDEWNDDVYAGVSLTWNLLDWGLTRAKVSKAMARATQAALHLAQEDERIVLEVREARISLMDAVSRLTVTERAEHSARRNLESATDLWTNGLLRHSELLDAHTKLTDAQYATETARADVIIAQTTLDYATGRLKSEL